MQEFNGLFFDFMNPALAETATHSEVAKIESTSRKPSGWTGGLANNYLPVHQNFCCGFFQDFICVQLLLITKRNSIFADL